MRTQILFFQKKDGATLEDFVYVKDILGRETGLPITLETCYKFLVLLPLQADDKLEVLKHYYGIIHTNELIVRGIEQEDMILQTSLKTFSLSSSIRCSIARIRVK